MEARATDRIEVLERKACVAVMLPGTPREACGELVCDRGKLLLARKAIL
jgi:hypothetical protein